MDIKGDTACLREFTGKEARVLFCSDSKLSGLVCTIEKESRNVLTARKKGGATIGILKKTAIFEIAFPEGKSAVRGNDIIFLPEQRTKRLSR